MKKNIYTILICIAWMSTIHAQDVHFSQQAFSPLTLNPALAGAHHNLQGIINYRTQWNSIANPFTTTAASVDTRSKGNQRNREGHMAFGLNFFNDKAGDLQVSTTNVNLSVAYHAHIDNINTISFALNPGFGQRSLDGAKGKWASQYNGLSYDGTLPSGEDLNRNQFGYFDIGFGALFSSKQIERSTVGNEEKIFNVGLAAYHLNRPKYSFTETGDAQLPIRFSVFANSLIGISGTNVALGPAVYYQRQASAQQLLIGSDVRYTMQEGSRLTGRVKDTYITFGAYYRVKDAAVLRVGFDYSNYSFGLSYDMNVSSLSATSKSTSAIEIYLRYFIPEGGNTRRL